MKRALVLLVTLLLAIPLALGFMAGLAYYGARAEHIPAPTVVMLNKPLKPSGYNWRSPVFGGLVYRDFVKPSPKRMPDIGHLDNSRFDIDVPEGYETRATLTRMGETVWSGRAAELSGYEFIDNGRYRIEVECTRPTQSERDHGTLFYQAAFSVTVDPRYEASDSWVTQGDVFAMRIYNLGTQIAPHVESDFEDVFFVTNEVGQATAYIPISYEREPRSYDFFAGAGRSNWAIPLRVTDGNFTAKRVEPNKEYPYPHNASDAPQSHADYKEQIAPLLGSKDSTQYWDSVFSQPVLGEITSEYGTCTYVGSNEEPWHHPGIDIAADRGADVAAANNGRVLFAGELESTGNTVVIEHGGGLKTLYFHLDSVGVAPEDMVATGDIIGTVGSTGICEKPHLHFEVRLGQSALNPMLLINGTSRLYHFN